jgi:hypothetical protein
MKLTIQRSKWYRGQDSTESRLLRPDGRMCCLGFYAKALGATDDQIESLHTPAMCLSNPNILPNPFTWGNGGEWLLFLPPNAPKTIRNHQNSKTCSALMNLNDDREINDETREKEVKEIFAKNGVEVEFVD